MELVEFVAPIDEEASAAETAWEVVVRWGDQVLRHQRVRSEERFVLGHGGDLVVAADALYGARRWALVVHGQVHLPPEAPRETAADGTLRTRFGPLTVELRPTVCASAPPRGALIPQSLLLCVGAALLTVVGVANALSMLIPPPGWGPSSIQEDGRWTRLRPRAGWTGADTGTPLVAGTGATPVGSQAPPAPSTATNEPPGAPAAAVQRRERSPRPSVRAGFERTSVSPENLASGIHQALRASAEGWTSGTAHFAAPSAADGDGLFGELGEGAPLQMLGTGRGSAAARAGGGSGTIPLGSHGTAGQGGGAGAGHGYGRGAGRFVRDGDVPRMEAAEATVHGALSRRAVRRVIRRHRNEVQHCYEQSLLERPELSGRVLVQLMIGPAGRVEHAAVAESTLQHARSETCILSAARRWSFPVTSAGVVMVRYPFVFLRNPE